MIAGPIKVIRPGWQWRRRALKVALTNGRAAKKRSVLSGAFRALWRPHLTLSSLSLRPSSPFWGYREKKARAAREKRRVARSGKSPSSRGSLHLPKWRACSKVWVLFAKSTFQTDLWSHAYGKRDSLNLHHLWPSYPRTCRSLFMLASHKDVLLTNP